MQKTKFVQAAAVLGHSPILHQEIEQPTAALSVYIELRDYHHHVPSRILLLLFVVCCSFEDSSFHWIKSATNCEILGSSLRIAMRNRTPPLSPPSFT